MTPPRRFPRWLTAVAATLPLLFAACGDSATGPGAAKPVDPLAMAANIQDLDEIFTTPVFQSLGLASSYSPALAGPLATLRTLSRAAQATLGARGALSSRERRSVTMNLRAALVPPSGPSSAVVLPPELLGKTFEWDTVGFAGYVVTARQDPDAPADGVRFILYALDAFGTPILPLHELAYADLKDESSANQKLHVVVGAHAPAATYLDYAIIGTTTVSSSTATVVGYITDGTRQLNFDAAATATASTYVLDIRFDVNAASAHARLQATFSSPSVDLIRLDITFRLQFGTEVVTLTGYETLDLGTFEDTGKVTIGVNGGIYATADIGSGGPVFTGGGGQTLTAEDYVALNAIYGAVGAVANRFDALLAPGGSLAP